MRVPTSWIEMRRMTRARRGVRAIATDWSTCASKSGGVALELHGGAYTHEHSLALMVWGGGLLHQEESGLKSKEMGVE